MIVYVHFGEILTQKIHKILNTQNHRHFTNEKVELTKSLHMGLHESCTENDTFANYTKILREKPQMNLYKHLKDNYHNV